MLRREDLGGESSPAPPDRYFDPLDAVASLRWLQRRSQALIAGGGPLAGGGPRGRSTGSATDAAASIVAILVTADRRLRLLLGEHDREPADRWPSKLRLFPLEPAQETAAASADLTSVLVTAELLIGTISGATTEDWIRLRYCECAVAALVSVALHDVHHFLDELEAPRPLVGPARVAGEESGAGGSPPGSVVDMALVSARRGPWIKASERAVLAVFRPESRETPGSGGAGDDAA